jgi:hypothetical protein
MTSEPTHTNDDFDRLSWHDCHIWAVRFDAGDPDVGDWTSDLVLDLDFIVEWLQPSPDRFAFRVAPAVLTFHGVTDPRIEVNWQQTGFQAALHPVSIGAISRERLEHQKVHLDRPYYAWRIELNWPDGLIAFGALGFTQTLLAEPVLKDQQHLSRLERRRLTTG